MRRHTAYLRLLADGGWKEKRRRCHYWPFYVRGVGRYRQEIRREIDRVNRPCWVLFRWGQIHFRGTLDVCLEQADIVK